MEGRDLERSERTRLRRVLQEEDRTRDALQEVLDRRDALLRDLRWGGPGRGPVMPEVLRAATTSKHHPDGLGRTTLHRAVGRARDRRCDDEQEH